MIVLRMIANALRAAACVIYPPLDLDSVLHGDVELDHKECAALINRELSKIQQLRNAYLMK